MSKWVRYDPAKEAMDAHTAMELFDLAAALLEHVRGPEATQRSAGAIARHCISARNRQLAVMDRALAKIPSPSQGGGT